MALLNTLNTNIELVQLVKYILQLLHFPNLLTSLDMPD